MHLVFYESDSIHPKGHLKISDLARKLEKEYSIISLFTQYIERALFNEIKATFNKSRVIQMAYLNQWLLNEWRRYIKTGGTGIITMASLLRGDISQSFIDSGAYFENMRIKCVFSEEEKRVFGVFYSIIEDKTFI